ncbi:hypothetical protein [Actinomadura flavalba]|uniref:hypothetical protein n=1 Tax=Actinomadura flavalba TaxID=1120938 RepID=UPI00037D0293|nr:hypothetical protein [Actinomadura flavalba]
MPLPLLPVSRRAVLGAAVAAVPLAGGCADEAPARSAAAHAQLPVLLGAIAAEQRLVGLYEAAGGGDLTPALTAHVGAALAHHREHLAALRRLYVPGSGRRAEEGGAMPVPVTQQVPAGRAELVRALREAEAGAARARLAEVARTSPGLAQVLASIGACEAGHAAVLAAEAPA